MSIDADLVVLRALARSFLAAADELSGRATSFAATVHLSPEAFGPLPSGQQAQAGYAQSLQTTTDSLRRLEATLRQFASNLEMTASNWEQADQISTLGGL